MILREKKIVGTENTLSHAWQQLPQNDSAGRQSEHAAGIWKYTRLLGRVTEISADRADASLSLAMQLVYDAQCHSETVAWIGDHESSFYPLDAIGLGVDIQRVVVVRATAQQAIQATYELARSGSFGLLVIDLTQFRSLHVQEADLAKLLALAQKHQSALLFLTHKSEHMPSLGALISFRAHARRKNVDGYHYTCLLDVLKDKRPVHNHQGHGQQLRQELTFRLKP